MTNDDFAMLMDLEKAFSNPRSVKLPFEQTLKKYDVSSVNTKDAFLLRYDRRGRYEFKHKNQLTHGNDFPLVRLEINAPEHKNPDGYITSRNHIHVYREGYGLSWAYEFNEIFLLKLDEVTPLELFTLFCGYCKIDLSNIILQGVV